MNRQDVEKTITEYLSPIFGFALKRCKSIHDAEDLSQEIAIRAFRALLKKDDVADMGKFIWTVAHNALSNYYRDTAKSMVGVSIDEVVELIAAPCFETDTDDNKESIQRLQTEIAYLSKLQRRIFLHKIIYTLMSFRRVRGTAVPRTLRLLSMISIFQVFQNIVAHNSQA